MCKDVSELKPLKSLLVSKIWPVLEEDCDVSSAASPTHLHLTSPTAPVSDLKIASVVGPAPVGSSLFRSLGALPRLGETCGDHIVLGT